MNIRKSIEPKLTNIIDLTLVYYHLHQIKKRD